MLGFAAAAGLLSPASAQEGRPSLQDSFRLGTGGDGLCQVQSRGTDPALKTMFDRAYAIVCRDAAQPIGRVYALRVAGGDPLARLAEIRARQAQCEAAAEPVTLDTVGAATRQQCSLTDAKVGYRVYTLAKRRTVYVAEGLAGYDSAITLALRSIVADRALPGEIVIADTEAGDPTAFARVQAGSLDLAQALDEGYRRNNSGNYAEAAEFFDTLLERAGETKGLDLGEFIINRALQKSNLGAFAEADALFARADTTPTADPVQLRLRRNYKTLHLMNQQRFGEASALLAAPLPVARASAGVIAGKPEIPAAAAEQINTGLPFSDLVGGVESATLTPEERARILDAQAVLLTGSIARIEGRPAEARLALAKAQADLLAIRDGRVTSIARLRSQSLNELSRLAELEGNHPEAERMLQEAVTLLTAEYPGSVAVAAAHARLAAFYARRGNVDGALTLYRGIVDQAGSGALSANVPPDMLAPYFALITRELGRRPLLVNDFFLAGETLVRPGVANTQAVLARELSAGDDEAARLFRQAVTLTRESEQARIALSRLRTLPSPSAEEAERIATLSRDLRTLQAAQASTQARLADFPRYRALAPRALTLDELRKTLRPGEAYLKTLEVGGAVYAMLATPSAATAYRTAIGVDDLRKSIETIRNSIVVVENGAPTTYPFDVTAARTLYRKLFEPISAELAAIRHVIFEPSGALLTLPINLLVMDDASVQTYARAAPKDEFDFRGVKWLGRGRDISTAVSARAFSDVRAIAPSRARLEYLGLGENAPVGAMMRLASAQAEPCAWPLENWGRPISARELFTAQRIIGAGSAQVLTGPAFTDAALRARDDLSQYRILHFATHGLVAAPRPECPAQPALLTSFALAGDGTPTSDGLLTFQEIFDLRFDADLIILSACDTAGAATAQATAEAGLSRGGDYALDGLVRAFVGAGGRTIVASHWPAPDDFDATERLIGGLFTAPAGTSVVDALRIGQEQLMDEANTSHPYYWAGFAVVGDGTRSVLRTPAAGATTAAH